MTDNQNSPSLSPSPSPIPFLMPMPIPMPTLFSPSLSSTPSVPSSSSSSSSSLLSSSLSSVSPISSSISPSSSPSSPSLSPPPSSSIPMEFIDFSHQYLDLSPSKVSNPTSPFYVSSAPISSSPLSPLSLSFDSSVLTHRDSSSDSLRNYLFSIRHRLFSLNFTKFNLSGKAFYRGREVQISMDKEHNGNNNPNHNNTVSVEGKIHWGESQSPHHQHHRLSGGHRGSVPTSHGVSEGSDNHSDCDSDSSIEYIIRDDSPPVTLTEFELDQMDQSADRDMLSGHQDGILYFYVNTRYDSIRKCCFRFYVESNWLPHLSSLIMNSTEISGIGLSIVLHSCHKSLTSLSCNDCNTLNNIGIYTLITHCNNLKILEFSHCPNIDSHGFIYLSEMSPEVSRRVEKIDVRSEHLPSNVFMGMAHCLESKGFKGIFIYFHQESKRGVQVAFPPKDTGNDSDNSMCKYSKHYLTSPDTLIDMEMCQISKKCLVEISVDHIEKYYEERRQRVVNLLSVAQRENYQRYLQSNQYPQLNRTQRYYSLDLSDQLINDTLCELILKRWGPYIVSLKLNGTFITQSSLVSIGHCVQLRSLSLDRCYNIISKAEANKLLMNSLKMIFYLQDISMRETRLSGRIFSAHPMLNLFHLYADCCPISTHAIRAIADTSYASLRVLSLSHCAFINTKSIFYILKFVRLERLDLSFCPALTDHDVFLLMRWNPSSIQEFILLTVLGIRGMNDENCRKLADYLTAIKTMDKNKETDKEKEKERRGQGKALALQSVSVVGDGKGLGRERVGGAAVLRANHVNNPLKSVPFGEKSDRFRGETPLSESAYVFIRQGNQQNPMAKMEEMSIPRPRPPPQEKSQSLPPPVSMIHSFTTPNMDTHSQTHHPFGTNTNINVTMTSTPNLSMGILPPLPMIHYQSSPSPFPSPLSPYPNHYSQISSNDMVESSSSSSPSASPHIHNNTNTIDIPLHHQISEQEGFSSASPPISNTSAMISASSFSSSSSSSPPPFPFPHLSSSSSPSFSSSFSSPIPSNVGVSDFSFNVIHNLDAPWMNSYSRLNPQDMFEANSLHSLPSQSPSYHIYSHINGEEEEGEGEGENEREREREGERDNSVEQNRIPSHILHSETSHNKSSASASSSYFPSSDHPYPHHHHSHHSHHHHTHHHTDPNAPTHHLNRFQSAPPATSSPSPFSIPSSSSSSSSSPLSPSSPLFSNSNSNFSDIYSRLTISDLALGNFSLGNHSGNNAGSKTESEKEKETQTKANGEGEGQGQGKGQGHGQKQQNSHSPSHDNYSSLGISMNEMDNSAMGSVSFVPPSLSTFSPLPEFIHNFIKTQTGKGSGSLSENVNGKESDPSNETPHSADREMENEMKENTKKSK